MKKLKIYGWLKTHLSLFSKKRLTVRFLLLTLFSIIFLSVLSGLIHLPFPQNIKQLIITDPQLDFEADKIFGQSDYTETSPNQVVSNRVFHPQGLAIDRNATPNKIYIWDSGNNRILGLTIGREKADLVFGQPDMKHASCNGNNTENAPFASASFLCSQKFGQISLMESPQPNSLAVDQNHNLYAFDPYNNRVLKYNNPYSSDKTQRKGDTVADFVWGQPDFKSRRPNQGGSLNNKTLSGDYGVGVDVDSQGNVWVADVGNRRVLRFPPYSKEADLVFGQPDFMSSEDSACNFCYRDQENINKGELTSCRGPYAGTIPKTDLPSQQNFCMPKAVRINFRTEQVYVLDWTFVVDTKYGTESNYFRVLIYNPPFTNYQVPSEVIIGNGHRRFPSSLGIPLYRATAIEIDPNVSDAFWLVGAASNKIVYIQKIAGVWRITKQLTDGLESPGGVALDSMGNVYTDTLHNGQEIKRFKAPIPTTCPSCSPYPFETRILKSQNTAFASPNKVSGAGLRDPSNVLLADYTNGSKQMLVADRSRVIIWNDYENKDSGSTADSVLFEPDMETLSSAGKSIWTIYKDALDRIWMAGSGSEVFVFQGPISSGQAPLKIINTANLFSKTGEVIQTGGAITGIVFNENENALWIADTRKHRLIRIADPLEDSIRKVDMVIGQPNNDSILANRGVDNDDDHSNPDWHLCSHLVADGFSNISGLFYDNFKNLYVADGSREGWQCSNNRLLEFDREALIPDPNKVFFQQGERVPKRVYGGSDFTNKNVYKDRDNIPYTPIAVAFNSKNEMLMTVDGYSNNYQKRSFLFSKPLPACSTSCRITDSTVLPIPGAQLSSPSFDSEGNLAILDHTWNRVLYFSKFPSSPDLPITAPIIIVSPRPTATIIPTPTLIPGVTITPRPTNTPVPTPTFSPANPYCSTCGFYSNGPYQDQGSRTGSSLPNTWTQYIDFISFTSGSLNGARIKINVLNPGIIGCKITDSRGTVDLTEVSIKTVNNGLNQWPCFSFRSAHIIGGVRYRLYCRKVFLGDFRWIYNEQSAVAAKTYAICLQPPEISPILTPTIALLTPTRSYSLTPTRIPSLSPVSVCPCSIEQPLNDNYLMGLTDRYDPNKYSLFTSPNYQSQVDKVSIRAKREDGQNVYPANIICKITNDVKLGQAGSVDISVEKTSADFYDTINWQDLNYSTNKFSLSPNTKYRLYCKAKTVPDNAGKVVNWTWMPPYGANASRRICLCQITPTRTY